MEIWQVKALINLNIKANYIKRKLALKIKIFKLLNKVILLTLLKGKKIYLYKDHKVKVIIKDILRE